MGRLPQLEASGKQGVGRKRACQQGCEGSADEQTIHKLLLLLGATNDLGVRDVGEAHLQP